MIFRSKTFDPVVLFSELQFQLADDCMGGFTWSRLILGEPIEWRIRMEDL